MLFKRGVMQVATSAAQSAAEAAYELMHIILHLSAEEAMSRDRDGSGCWSTRQRSGRTSLAAIYIDAA